MIWYDKDVVDKCIYNLLSNAFKFTGDNQKISLLVQKTVADSGKEYLKIIVEDSGIGIKKEEQEKVFDCFYQAESKPSFQAEGSGIGLHIVKEMMLLHKGFVSLQSEFGKGACFSLYFPMFESEYQPDDFFIETTSDYTTNSTGHPVPELPNSSEPKAKSAYSILVVEDHDDMREMLYSELSGFYTAWQAKNGNEALEILEAHNIDLIISDISMPYMDGIELCTLVKTNVNTSHIPVILLTAKANIESQIEGIWAGADDYIPKPFNLELLKLKVNNILENRALLQKKYKNNLLTEIAKQEVGTESSMDAVFMQKAVEMVKQNLINPDLNGEYLASQLNISRMHLHRKLKALTNLSSSEFIRNIRLEEAILLLKKKEMTITEAAYATGFSSPAYFSTSFTKYFGLSPKEYLLKKEV
ncbi:MAG: Sensor histidine kinase TmoS [Candidatus Ordinivivax streblomastigis]|uniref:histidine kinase n=1 Tax=Candidatus Ordinivivax streblomastigis TaxID=2540710 RepID=A0A5M8P379_9BACT|nr:MAG: Sensor histidine kinase TmoS [Candidatus Ordinivivax streblomastigis]